MVNALCLVNGVEVVIANVPDGERGDGVAGVSNGDGARGGGDRAEGAEHVRWRLQAQLILATEVYVVAVLQIATAVGEVEAADELGWQLEDLLLAGVVARRVVPTLLGVRRAGGVPGVGRTGRGRTHPVAIVALRFLLWGNVVDEVAQQSHRRRHPVRWDQLTVTVRAVVGDAYVAEPLRQPRDVMGVVVDAAACRGVQGLVAQLRDGGR